MPEKPFLQYGQLRLVKPVDSSAEHTSVDSSARSLAHCSSSDARACVSLDTASTFMVLPLGLLTLFGREVLTLAISDLPDSDTERSMRFAAGRDVRFVRVDKEVLRRAIFFAYSGDDRVLTRALGALGAPEDENDSVVDPPEDMFRSVEGDTAEFLVSIVEYALSKGASDLHLVPLRSGAFIRLRVDGELLNHPDPAYGHRTQAALINRIKVLAQLDIAEKKVPQDGAFSVPLPWGQCRIRVSTMPTLYGERVVLRFSTTKRVRALDNLGLDTSVLQMIHRTVLNTEGSILVVGPTGSGKTTSLYSMLAFLEAKGLNIVSVEDPVECDLEHVSQTCVSEKDGLSFSRCLRSVVRQDPDVIMIGEIRDAESAAVSIDAAMTGHLVLTSMHARSVFEAIHRFQRFGVHPFEFGQTVRLILAQQLVPELCSSCAVLDLSNSNRLEFQVHKPVGCTRCDYTGYQGVRLACEALEVREPIRALLRDGKTSAAELTEHLCAESYIPFSNSVRKLLRDGKVSLEYAHSICSESF